MDAGYAAIRRGAVKDRLKPEVAGVGFMGSSILVSDPFIIDFYKPWNDMINRCYNKNDKDYKYYGGIGITVDPRWFNFTVFMYDAVFLPNAEKKFKYPMIYQLDKDYLQFNVPKHNRIYSKDTCMWLSLFDNTMIMTRDHENISGYYGVTYKDNTWMTRVNGVIYGKFTCPEAAANLFNYLYPKLMHMFNDVMILNDVEKMPYEELSKYCVGSTTIREVGAETKWFRSNRESL